MVTRKRRVLKTWLLTAMVAVFFVLHQDVWNWQRVDPLLFGFLPMGLWYHALYSVVAAGVMWVLVRHAWPIDVQSDSTDTPPGNPE